MLAYSFHDALDIFLFHSNYFSIWLDPLSLMYFSLEVVSSLADIRQVALMGNKIQ